MKEENIDGWIKVFETPEIMEAEIMEARFRDEGIEYRALNKMDLGYTWEIGKYWTYNAVQPIKLFVEEKDLEKTLDIVNEDRSNILDDPNAEFEDPETSSG